MAGIVGQGPVQARVKQLEAAMEAAIAQAAGTDEIGVTLVKGLG